MAHPFLDGTAAVLSRSVGGDGRLVRTARRGRVPQARRALPAQVGHPGAGLHVPAADRAAPRPGHPRPLRPGRAAPVDMADAPLPRRAGQGPVRRARRARHGPARRHRHRRRRPGLRARRARPRLARRPRRLPVHLRRAHRVPEGPRRRRPHRLRGQAPGRPAARARVRLRHLAHRPAPVSRASGGYYDGLPVRAGRLQGRLRARRPRAVDREGGPHRGHGAGRREQRGDRQPPCARPPGRAAPPTRRS